MDKSRVITCKKCGMPLKKGTKICSYCQQRTGHIARAPKEKKDIAVQQGRKHKWIPWVSLALILLNVAVGLYKVATGEAELLIKYGMIRGALQHGQFLRLIFNGFLHINLLHLACNMSSLVFYGFLFENRISRWKYLLIYIVSMLGASLMINFFGGDALHIGASGAIFGIMTANLIYCLKTKRKFLYLLIAILSVSGNVVSTFAYGISWQGHLGGAITGVIMGLILFARERKPQ